MKDFFSNDPFEMKIEQIKQLPKNNPIFSSDIQTQDDLTPEVKA